MQSSSDIQASLEVGSTSMQSFPAGVSSVVRACITQVYIVDKSVLVPWVAQSVPSASARSKARLERRNRISSSVLLRVRFPASDRMVSDLVSFGLVVRSGTVVVASKPAELSPFDAKKGNRCGFGLVPPPGVSVVEGFVAGKRVSIGSRTQRSTDSVRTVDVSLGVVSTHRF